MSLIIHKQGARQGSGQFPENSHCPARNGIRSPRPASRRNTVWHAPETRPADHPGLPGLRAGNTSAVLRLALIARLEETASGTVFQSEVNRRLAWSRSLIAPRRPLAARRD